jgi:hypothetical protein
MNVILGMLVWLFCALPLHELGHYLIAKALGLNNIHFGVQKWRKIPFAIVTIAEPDETLYKNPIEFHYVASSFQLMGGLFTITGLLAFATLDILSTSACLFLVVFETCYMAYETINPKHIKKEEV